MLLRRNYKINSGLCPRCGSELDNKHTSNNYSADKSLLDMSCAKCSSTKNKRPIIKTIFLVIFFVWGTISIAIFRGVSLGN